jgi:hypothetical protein
MRRATFVLCLINAAFLFSQWRGLGSSDPAGNAIMAGLLEACALTFAVTALPAFALAVAGWLPRVAFWLAVVCSSLILLIYAI